MKQMKNGVAIGAIALFALTGCVADVAYVPQGSGEQPCVQGPCEEAKGEQQAAQQVVAQDVVQMSGPVAAAPMVAQQDLGEGLPTNVNPGECYSRCLAPAVFEDVEEQIEVAPAMERTEIIPAEYEWVDEEVIAKEASEKIKVIPAQYDWVEEEVLVKEASEEIKVIPARYEWQDVQEVVKEASEELKAIPAVYAWREGQVMVSPEMVKITLTDPGFQEVKEQVLVKAPSAKWIKKATHCSPEDIKMGLTDCDTLCYVAVPAMYKTVIKKVPTDCAGGVDGCRQEVVIPAEYKPIRTKVVVEPARTETVQIPAEYRMVRKQVLVEPARTEVVNIPAEYRMVRKRVMVEPARTEVIPVPAEYKTVKVKKLVKAAEENVIQVPAEYKTIIKKVKVSDSKIVWRPALCEDEAVDSKIREMQSALSREGFYAGEINGVLTPETNEALRAYQADRALPQGGGMTIETLESLGIY
ncbi:MAG: peptidoglycan-binding domain-containing protein [Candidatus Electrothrix sp. GW3-4]|uniref:peptidoglycan-binding domain-containing protein n=1 Tax=Candidatus Electrothrix sp. GW3-4 TaxID=3126740 RepID=UPI0030CC74CD